MEDAEANNNSLSSNELLEIYDDDLGCSAGFIRPQEI